MIQKFRYTRCYVKLRGRELEIEDSIWIYQQQQWPWDGVPPLPAQPTPPESTFFCGKDGSRRRRLLVSSQESTAAQGDSVVLNSWALEMSTNEGTPKKSLKKLEQKCGDVLEIFCPLKNWRFFEDPIRCKIAGEQSLPLEGQMILRCVPWQHDKKVRSTSPY